MTPVPGKRKRLSAREREQCFDDAGGICCLCKRPIHRGEGFDIHHVIELAAGGEDVRANRRPSHPKCHRIHTATYSAPHVAKTRRQRQKDIGARPRSVMAGGRASKWKRKLTGEVVLR